MEEGIEEIIASQTSRRHCVRWTMEDEFSGVMHIVSATFSRRYIYSLY